MNAFSLSGYVTAILTFIMGLFVVARDRTAQIHRIFFIYSLAIASWSGFTATHAFWNDYHVSLFCARAMHVFVPFIAVLFFQFAAIYLNLRTGVVRILTSLGYLTALLIAVASLSGNYVVSDVKPKLGYYFFMSGGILYPFVIAQFVAYAIGGLYLLYSRLRVAEGKERKKLQYLFAGSFVGYAFGSSCFYPVYNITTLPYPYGSLAIAGYVFTTTYAIVRHRLLDIEVIIRKTIVFAGLFGMVMGIAAVVTALTQNFLGRIMVVNQTVSTILSMIFAILLYAPTRKLLAHLTDRYLFQKTFDYAKVLRDTSRDIALVTSLKQLIRKMIAVLARKARTKNAAIFVRSPEKCDFELQGCFGYGRKRRPEALLGQDSPLVTYLSERQAPVTCLALADEIKALKDEGKRGVLQKVFDSFQTLRAEVIVPSFLGISSAGNHNTASLLMLRGILILGGKKSDEDYYEQDLDMLATLAQEHAIAFENARLYDEQVKRREEMEGMNRELRKTQAQLVAAERKAAMVRFAAAIGHEVNNALVGIDSQARFALRDYLPKVEKLYEEMVKPGLSSPNQRQFEKYLSNVQKACRSAVDGSRRIEVIIQTLTNILKDTRGGFSEINFRVIWEESWAEALEAAGLTADSGCRYEMDIPKNFMIYGNQGQLQRVFVNLAKNGLEAMSKQAEKRMQVKAGYEEGTDAMPMVWIKVSDNGPGIPPDVIGKIFDQGFSTKTKTSASLGAAGQGQGLYVCRQIVETVHQGKIEAESLPDGAIFIIRLPVGASK